MALFSSNNQLLQIDSGNALTTLYNPAAGLTPYSGIGENQILGQRYFASNPVLPAQVGFTAATYPASYQAALTSGSPAVYMLVQMLPSSAMTLAQWQGANAPAPVYWADQTFSTVTPIITESFGGLGLAAGYWMPNYASLPNATLAQLLGGVGLIQISGFLAGAWGPTTTPGAGKIIAPTAAGASFTSTGLATGVAGSIFGIQLTAIASGVCNVLVNCDIF